MPGFVERAVRSDIAAMVTTAPAGESLAALAYALAAVIDQGQRCRGCGCLIEAGDPKTLPGLVGRLTAVLNELAVASVGDDDDLAAALSAVSAPVRDET